MNNFQKIAKIILKKMDSVGNKKPTVSIVYESIIEVYPKLAKQNTNAYYCYRIVIIEEISSFYDSEKLTEIKSIQRILNRFAKECLES